MEKRSMEGYHQILPWSTSKCIEVIYRSIDENCLQEQASLKTDALQKSTPTWLTVHKN